MGITETALALLIVHGGGVGWGVEGRGDGGVEGVRAEYWSLLKFPDYSLGLPQPCPKD